MKCQKCKRRVADTLEAKMVHIAKNHPDILLVRAIHALFNPDTAFELGKMFGDHVKREFNKTYGPYAKISKIN
jgi:hypothetical protein